MRISIESIAKKSTFINRMYYGDSPLTSQAFLDFNTKHLYLRSNDKTLAKVPFSIENDLNDLGVENLIVDSKKLLSVCTAYSEDDFIDVSEVDGKIQFSHGNDIYKLPVTTDSMFFDLSVFESDEDELEDSLAITEEFFMAVRKALKYLDSNWKIQNISMKEDSLGILSPDNTFYFKKFSKVYPSLAISEELGKAITSFSIGDRLEIYPNKYILTSYEDTLVIPRDSSFRITEQMFTDAFSNVYTHEDSYITFDSSVLGGVLSALSQFTSDIENNIISIDIEDGQVSFIISSNESFVKKEVPVIAIEGDFDFKILFSSSSLLKTIKDLSGDQVQIQVSNKLIPSAKGDPKPAYMCKVVPLDSEGSVDDSGEYLAIKRFVIG